MVKNIVMFAVIHVFFPKASPMLGFSFRHFVAREREGVLDGDGSEMGRKERRKEGRKEGRKGGREEGRKGGWEDGRKEGRKEGRQEGRKEGRKGGRKEGREGWREGGRERGREGGREDAGRTGNRANSLGRASLGGSETACWTERKPCK